MSLCQTCTRHDCTTPGWLEEVNECEQYKPPYGFIKCDICHTPTSPVHLHRVKDRTKLVYPGCVDDGIELLEERIKEAAQEAKSEQRGDIQPEVVR